MTHERHVGSRVTVDLPARSMPVPIHSPCVPYRSALSHMSLSSCERYSPESAEALFKRESGSGGAPGHPVPSLAMVYAPHPFFNARNLLEQQTLTTFIKNLNGLAGPLKGRQKPPHLVQFTTQTTVGQALRVSK